MSTTKTWRCDGCKKEFDESVLRPLRGPETPCSNQFCPTFLQVCRRCKWYKAIEDCRREQLEDQICSGCQGGIPCENCEDDQAHLDTINHIKGERRKKNISDDTDISQEEHEMLCAYKRSRLEYYQTERRKKNGKFQKLKRAREEWQDRMENIQLMYEIQHEQQQQEAKAAKKKRKTPSSSSSSSNDGKSKSQSKRICLDCTSEIDAGEPKWKVRCLNCWKKNKQKNK